MHLRIPATDTNWILDIGDTNTLTGMCGPPAVVPRHAMTTAPKRISKSKNVRRCLQKPNGASFFYLFFFILILLCSPEKRSFLWRHENLTYGKLGGNRAIINRRDNNNHSRSPVGEKFQFFYHRGIDAGGRVVVITC